MPDQTKPKITIDPDGTIHVDNGDQQRPTTGTSSSSARSASASSTSTPHETPPKTAARAAAERRAAQSQQNTTTRTAHEFRNTQAQTPANQPQRRTVGGWIGSALIIFFVGLIIGGFLVTMMPWLSYVGVIAGFVFSRYIWKLL